MDENKTIKPANFADAGSDDTMESEVQVDKNQKLPLHPILVDENEEDAPNAAAGDTVVDGVPVVQNPVFATTGSGALIDTGDNGDSGADVDSGADAISDPDDTETSSVAAVTNAGKNSPITAFPMPDLREREDGGAIDFEEDEPKESSVAQENVSESARLKSRAEFTTVYDIIDAMEAMLAEAKGAIFAPGMVKIDRDNFVDQLARLKDMLPVQLERASALMREAERHLRTAQAQASSIVSSAQLQSSQIIDEAQERAQFLAGQENVTALARQKAREILASAQAKSDKLTQGADQYCATVMEGLKQQLDKLEQDVQAGQRVLEERRQAAAHVQHDISASLYEDDDDNDERN